MFIKLVITLTFATFCSAAAAKDFYVSPSGSDKLNGLSPSVNFWTKTGPFKTLTRARNAIRQLKAAGKFNEAITVYVGKGTYQLQSSLDFDDKDAGEPGKEIIWAGEKGASIISGGIVLKNCQPISGTNPHQILSCPLSAEIATNIKGEVNERISGNAPAFELFIDGHRMHLARWPDYDWAHIKLPLNLKTQFSVVEKIPPLSGDLSNAQIHTYAGNDTFDEYIGILNIDQSNNKIILSSETHDNLASGRRFYLQNVETALDAPEEWFFDKTNNQILLIAPIGTKPNNIVISSSTNLLRVKDLSDIRLSNLTFQHSTSNAININRSSTLILDNLDINNVAGQAIRCLTCTNVTIHNSNIHDTGQGGILMLGGDRPTLEPSGNIISNNIILNYDSILFNNSPAVSIRGTASTVSHNLIQNGNGNAIILNGNDHLIEKNDISKICQQSSDCGAIYSGRDWTYRGNIIRYNSIHDFSGYQLYNATFNISKNIIQYVKDGARGIYLDDGVSGFTVYGNILENAGQMSIQIGGGRDNRIENNIIKTNKYSILTDYRSQHYNWSINRQSLTSMPISDTVWQAKYPELRLPMHNDKWPEGNTIRQNIIISTASNGQSIRYWMPKQTNNISNNLVWRENGDIRVDYNILDTGAEKGGSLWEDWLSQGIEKNSLFANPCLTITGNSISISCANSPIYQIGFKPIPTDIGPVD
ncbi:right-handed parallel beta-helix repeat-containing protein [Methylomonas methanica]|uniref:Right handed beta helix domain-containing protein n=1 Tax=Methylomonas methanica TaxID=421 RepID=A0A177MHT0_METMH|nr:right-handed parallel beta-helix repeat-containing protein [Methylomonas methanica]OAI04480.1 hypothetical protein A1332_01915 [Methylomonas methanica]